MALGGWQDVTIRLLYNYPIKALLAMASGHSPLLAWPEITSGYSNALGTFVHVSHPFGHAWNYERIQVDTAMLWGRLYACHILSAMPEITSSHGDCSTPAHNRDSFFKKYPSKAICSEMFYTCKNYRTFSCFVTVIVRKFERFVCVCQLWCF